MTTDTVGGVWTYALDLCSGLAEYGIEVVLAAMGPRLLDHQEEAARGLPNVRLEFRPYALEWMPDPWTDVDASESWLLDLCQAHDVTLLHANTYAHGALALNLPVLVVGHSCVYSWYRAVRRTTPPSYFDEYRRRVTRGTRAADVVVAPSRAMLLALQEHYGPFSRALVVPNGRCLDGFSPSRKQPVVLSAGRLWDEAKNMETLERAASNLPWPICVAGEPRAPQGGESTRDLGRLTCLGVLQAEDLASLLARASIYAAPARYEPFGLAILEAAASGCALVLGDIPSLREVWGNAATFVPPDDVDALSRALRELMREPALCVERGMRARERARLSTHHRMASAYRDIYAGLLDACSDSPAHGARGAHTGPSMEVRS